MELLITRNNGNEITLPGMIDYAVNSKDLVTYYEFPLGHGVEIASDLERTTLEIKDLSASEAREIVVSLFGQSVTQKVYASLGNSKPNNVFISESEYEYFKDAVPNYLNYLRGK